MNVLKEMTWESWMLSRLILAYCYVCFVTWRLTCLQSDFGVQRKREDSSHDICLCELVAKDFVFKRGHGIICSWFTAFLNMNRAGVCQPLIMNIGNILVDPWPVLLYSRCGRTVI